MAFSIEERTLIKIYSDPDNLSRDNVLQNIEHNLPGIEDSELVEQLTGLIRKISALTETNFQKIDFTDIIGY
jgi:hypothetical protein